MQDRTPLGRRLPTERRAATPEEAKALANPLRLRILRLCLDRALTNEELAARLGRDAGSMLHHVRMLVETGFLAPEEERRGPRGSVERPYRATGKSWTLDVHDDPQEGGAGQDPGTLALIDAFRDEVAEVPRESMMTTARLGVRLTPEALESFGVRFKALIDEMVAADDPAGEPYGVFIGMHKRAD